MHQIERLLEPLLERARHGEPERAEGVIAARGMADASVLLHRTYSLIVTNVPFLGKGEQSAALSQYIERHYPYSRSCLSTVMLERITRLASKKGTVASVTKQEWCFLVSYRDFRRFILSERTLNFIAFLGEEAWEAFGQRGPLATLSAISNCPPTKDVKHFSIDLTRVPERLDKMSQLSTITPGIILQRSQLENPDARISFVTIEKTALLNRLAQAYQGLITGDGDKFRRCFWEIKDDKERWKHFQSTPTPNDVFSGREGVLLWERNGSEFARKLRSICIRKYRRGCDAISTLSPSYFYGDLFDNNIAPIIPYDIGDAAAIAAYCQSQEFKNEVKTIDNKKNVKNATLTKVP